MSGFWKFNFCFIYTYIYLRHKFQGLIPDFATIPVKNFSLTSFKYIFLLNIYIYIYIERERERERDYDDRCRKFDWNRLDNDTELDSSQDCDV